MVLKIPLYLSIEGLDYDDLSLEDFKELQEILSDSYTCGIYLTSQTNIRDTEYLYELMKDWFEGIPKDRIERFLECSELTSKKSILSTPRLIGREEALAHLRKDLS